MEKNRKAIALFLSFVMIFSVFATGILGVGINTVNAETVPPSPSDRFVLAAHINGVQTYATVMSESSYFLLALTTTNREDAEVFEAILGYDGLRLQSVSKPDLVFGLDLNDSLYALSSQYGYPIVGTRDYDEYYYSRVIAIPVPIGEPEEEPPSEYPVLDEPYEAEPVPIDIAPVSAGTATFIGNIPTQNILNVSAGADADLAAGGMIRAGRPGGQGTSFLDNSLSWWSGIGIPNEAGQVGSGRVAYIRVPIPTEFDRNEIEELLVEFTIQGRHNAGNISLSLISLNEPLDPPFGTEWHIHSAAGDTFRGRFTGSQIAATSNTITTPGDAGPRGQTLTFDLTDYILANPTSRLEFAMVADRQMLSLFSPAGTHANYNPPAGENWRPRWSVSLSLDNFDPGAAITAPATANVVTYHSISVNAAIMASGTDQTIEYAISTDGLIAPVTGWQSGLIFENLLSETDYFVWARSALSVNYAPGTPVPSLPIITPVMPDIAVAITNAAAIPATGMTGTLYSFQFEADGRPAPTWSVTSGTLPDGLTLSSGGLLSGLPTSAAVGNHTFTVTAENRVNNDSVAVTIDINLRQATGSVTVGGNTFGVFGNNRFINGSFELGNASSNIIGWTMWGMENANLVTTVVGPPSDPGNWPVPHGNVAMRFGRRANYNWATLFQDVPLVPGASYVFAVQLAAPRHVAHDVTVHIYDGNVRLSSFTVSRDQNNFFGWQELSRTFAVSPLAQNPRAHISFGSGTHWGDQFIYMDDFRIYELNDPSLYVIDEPAATPFTGDFTVTLLNTDRELELVYVGDNTAPTGRYDNRSKFMDDIMFNINRDFGGPDLTGLARVGTPVDIHDRASFDLVTSAIRNDPHNNPFLNTRMMDRHIEQVVAFRPGYINYLAIMTEAYRMGIAVLPVSNPWWQYIRTDSHAQHGNAAYAQFPGYNNVNWQANYTADQLRSFYSLLWTDAWVHGFIRGYIHAAYFGGQIDYAMGNEPDNLEGGWRPYFTDWHLFGYVNNAVADGFRSGVQAGGIPRQNARLWGPALAGWRPTMWNRAMTTGYEAFDVWAFHFYGGGPGQNRSRINHFHNNINHVSPRNDHRVAVTEFNWRLSGQGDYRWLDRQPHVVEHIRIMHDQASGGQFASIRFSFPELFRRNVTTGRFFEPWRMYYGIRHFMRALTNNDGTVPNRIVDFTTHGATVTQEFFITRSENSYYIHLNNRVSNTDIGTLTVDVSNRNVPDGSYALLRVVSDSYNDEVVERTTVQNGSVSFNHDVTGGNLYLVVIRHSPTNIQSYTPVINRGFGYADSIEIWWSNRSYFTSFNVYRSTDGISFTQVATELFNSWFDDYDVIPGQRYWYQISVEAFGQRSQRSEIIGPIVTSPTAALPLLGDFEGNTPMARFTIVGDFTTEVVESNQNALGTAAQGQRSKMLTGGLYWRDYTVNTTALPRALPSGSPGMGRMGIIGRYQDANNFYMGVLDTISRGVYIIRVLNGVEEVLGRTPLPDPHFTVGTRNMPMSLSFFGNEISFFAESQAFEPPVGYRSARVTVQCDAIPTGRTGLFVENSRTAFVALRVVEVFHDSFTVEADDRWDVISGNWSVGIVDDGTHGNWWYNQASPAGENISLTTSGNIADGYVTAKIMNTGSGAAAIIAHYVDQNNFLRYQVQGNTLSVIARVNGTETTIASRALPQRHMPYVTVSVQFDRNNVLVAVSGMYFMSFQLHIPELNLGRFGVGTFNSTASFDMFTVSATSVPLQIPQFADTIDHPSNSFIAEMARWNYLTGHDAANFAPSEMLTRAEFISWVARLVGGRDNPPAYANAFADVNASHRYAQLLQHAFNAGIIPPSMIDGGMLDPNAYITREEMVAISIRAIELFRPRRAAELTSNPMATFEDRDDISSWAEDYFARAFGAWLIGANHDDLLDPQGTMTRAGGAQMLQRLYRNLYHHGSQVAPFPACPNCNDEGCFVCEYQPQIINRSVLAQAIQNAQARNSANYTAASWTNLTNALNAAVAVYNNAGATQQEINAAASALQAAINALASADTGIPQPPPGSGAGSGLPGGGGTAPPVEHPTIPVNDGVMYVSIWVSDDQETITLDLPSSVVREVINNSDEVASFDLTGQTYVATVTLPRTAVRALANAGLSVVFQLPQGTVTMSAEAVYSIGQQAGSTNISITVTQTEDGLYEVTVQSGDQVIAEFDGEITIGASAEEELPVDVPPMVIRFPIGSLVYTVDGIARTNDVAPFIDPAYDRAMLPLRAISEALGAEVSFDDVTRVVTIIRQDGVVLLLPVDVPLPGGMSTPVIINERTFVPGRYVVEFLRAVVRWDDSAQVVYVYK